MDDFYTLDPFYHGLVESKLDLIQLLEENCHTSFDEIYIHGCWNGLMAFMLYTRGTFRFNKIINIDMDQNALAVATRTLDALIYQNKVEFRNINSNDIVYSQKDLLVINVSTDNMTGNDWFTNIPSKNIVALQSRNGNHHDNINPIENITELQKRFPLRNVSKMERFFDYNGPQSYTRSTIVGFK